MRPSSIVWGLAVCSASVFAAGCHPPTEQGSTSQPAAASAGDRGGEEPTWMEDGR